MSFMFRPLAYDDPYAVNNIVLDEFIKEDFCEGNHVIISRLLDECRKQTSYVLCIDGYVSAQFETFIEEMKKVASEIRVYDMKDIYKTEAEINEMISKSLPLNYEDDPVLLFGKLYKGNMIDFMDSEKLNDLITKISKKEDGITIVIGMGSSIQAIRPHVDGVAYIDVTPKIAAKRACEGKFVNIGDQCARVFNLLMRRNYFVDFEVTLKLRKELLEQNLITFYILGNDETNYQMMSGSSLNQLMDTLIQYPFRAKPVYLEGIWGGEYIRKIRQIPTDISNNIAWIFEFIPMEVSIVIDIDGKKADIPFFTFVQKKGKEMMGKQCHEQFEGYFPIRFNYDDTWHSDGNMSVQVHPDEDFIIANYNEFGRQDEAYYVVASGHDAKTYAGWCNDGKEFLALAKQSEKTHEQIDYEKYINFVPSVVGTQVMLPAGTIHASGRNQLILELGSLTIGSYTYKVYDYNRRDAQGNVRPIHTKNAEKVLHYERDSKWVDENIAIQPILVEKTAHYVEYIVGKTDLMYYQTNRIQMDTHAIYEGHNNGQFTVLTLVDGEEIKVYSKSNPQFSFTQHYLDIVTIPATISDYVIEAKGYQPVVVHKTFLRDGYTRYKNLEYRKR